MYRMSYSKTCNLSVIFTTFDIRSKIVYIEIICGVIYVYATLEWKAEILIQYEFDDREQLQGYGECMLAWSAKNKKRVPKKMRRSVVEERMIA